MSPFSGEKDEASSSNCYPTPEPGVGGGSLNNLIQSVAGMEIPISQLSGFAPEEYKQGATSIEMIRSNDTVDTPHDKQELREHFERYK